MGYVVNIRDIETALLQLGGEATAKAIQEQVLMSFCNGIVPANYRHERSFRQTIQRKIEDFCPQAEGFAAAKRETKFLRVARGRYRHASSGIAQDRLAIEEVEAPEGLFEGAVMQIAVNAYERNATARRLCVAYHGYACKCCGFNFEQVYGERGKEFIHVHHSKPLAEIKESYVVDPILDLVPLCPNCHAMVHRTVPAMTVDALKEELKQAFVER